MPPPQLHIQMLPAADAKRRRTDIVAREPCKENSSSSDSPDVIVSYSSHCGCDISAETRNTDIQEHGLVFEEEAHEQEEEEVAESDEEIDVPREPAAATTDSAPGPGQGDADAAAGPQAESGDGSWIVLSPVSRSESNHEGNESESDSSGPSQQDPEPTAPTATSPARVVVQVRTATGRNVTTASVSRDPAPIIVAIHGNPSDYKVVHTRPTAG